jgi:hypothetical protein
MNDEFLAKRSPRQTLGPKIACDASIKYLLKMSLRKLHCCIVIGFSMPYNEQQDNRHFFIHFIFILIYMLQSPELGFPCNK